MKFPKTVYLNTTKDNFFLSVTLEQQPDTPVSKPIRWELAENNSERGFFVMDNTTGGAWQQGAATHDKGWDEVLECALRLYPAANLPQMLAAGWTLAEAEAFLAARAA